MNTTTLFQKAPRYEDALEIAHKVIEMFRKAEIDSVYVVVNNFKSMMASLLVTTRLLPVELPEKQEQIDYIYEQPPRRAAVGIVAALHRIANLSLHARIRRGSACRAHDRHGIGQLQCLRCHQLADAKDEPGPAGQYYKRDH